MAAGEFFAALPWKDLPSLELFSAISTVTPNHNLMPEVEAKAIEQHMAQGVVLLTQRLSQHPLKVTNSFARGYPATELLQRAQDTKAELLVVGSRGLNPMKRLLLGSTADRVVQNLTVSALVYREREWAAASEESKTLIVCVDGSQLARGMAAKVAKMFDLKKLRVICIAVLSLDQSTSWYQIPQDQSAWQAEEGKMRQALAEAAAFFGGAAQVQQLLIEDFDDPTQAIMHMAKTKKADLISIAARSETKFAAISLGSTTKRLTEYAECSVLIVR
jgi:nucleotide-binding universal stress UspA family protein